MRKLAAVLLGLALGAPGALAATLTNDDVVSLTQELSKRAEGGKLSKEAEDVIIKSINTNECRFDVSPSQIVKLSEAKVPIRIIDLMIDTHKEWRNKIKGAVQVALQGFKDNDPKQSERSRRELTLLGPDAIPEIDKQGLSSDSAPVRAGAIEVLGLIGHRDGLEPAFRMLLDRESEVRAAAAKALKSVAEDREKACARLTEMMASLEQPRDGAVLALGYLKDLRAAAEIRKLADSANVPLLRRAAVTALGLMKDKDSLKLLTECLLPDKPGSYNIDVSSAAAVSLAYIGDPQAISALIKAFERYPQQSARLVGPLSSFHDRRVVETLIDALDHTDTKTSDFAWEALKRLTGSEWTKNKTDWRNWWDLDGSKRF